MFMKTFNTYNFKKNFTQYKRYIIKNKNKNTKIGIYGNDIKIYNYNYYATSHMCAF